MAGKRNHDNFGIALANDYGVGKASEQQAFDSTPACDTGRGCMHADAPQARTQVT